MKKFVVALFLTMALVVPALAEGLELIPKIGYLFSPEITVDSKSASEDSGIQIGAEIFFDMQNNFFLGGGLIWGQNTKYDSKFDEKIGFTNLYVAIKYKFEINDSNCFIYPLFQVGFGMPGWDYSGFIWDYEIDSGLYWGAGVGAEVSNIVIDFIYGCNYAVIKGSNIKDKDFSYTAFRINVGYKFDL